MRLRSLISRIFHVNVASRVLTATCGSQLDHGVIAVGHATVLTAMCGRKLDHGVLASGHGTVECSQLRVERSLFMAFRHDCCGGCLLRESSQEVDFCGVEVSITSTSELGAIVRMAGQTLLHPLSHLDKHMSAT